MPNLEAPSRWSVTRSSAKLYVRMRSLRAPVDAFDAVKRGAASLALALTLSAHACAPASARLEGVNNPALLPPGPAAPVLDVAGYLTKSDVARLTTEGEALEKDTGVRLRVLAQAYPQTPGLAVKEYWNVDDDTVVFVADPGLGNILNFSVGGNLDLEIPPSFWTRLANKYGTKFYWSERGEEASISAAVRAIDACAREPLKSSHGFYRTTSFRSIALALVAQTHRRALIAPSCSPARRPRRRSKRRSSRTARRAAPRDAR